MLLLIFYLYLHNKHYKGKHKMRIINTEKGKCAGRISVAETVATMEVGEVWSTNEDEIGPAVNAQVAFSRYGLSSGKKFKSITGDNGLIIITRIS